MCIATVRLQVYTSEALLDIILYFSDLIEGSE